MIRYCPHCGIALKDALRDGIASCANCNRIFDSNHKSKILAGGWAARKHHIASIEHLAAVSGLQDADLEFVYEFVVVSSYSHDDLIKLIETEFPNLKSLD